MFELIVLAVVALVLLGVIYWVFFSPGAQVLGKVVARGQVSEKVVALTFDDGPNEPYTSQILEILAQNKIKATFFPVAENARRDPQAVKKIFAAGHVIGNHSQTHSFFAPIFAPRFLDELVESQKQLEKIIGRSPALFRPPWFFRQVAMLKSARELGLVPVTGTFCSYWEVFQVSAKKIAKDAVRNVRPGTILVFHDGYNAKGAKRAKTVEALSLTIDALKKSGYKFQTVPELLKIEPYRSSR